VKWDLWGGCRLRGRRVLTAGSRQNQTTKAGWVDAQEGDGAGTGFSYDGGALQRRCELTGDEQGRRKNRAREKEERRLLQSFIEQLRKQGEATAESFPC